jgi:hypothetical protein
MSFSDWVPRLLTNQQPDDLRFGADASSQQYPAPGLLDPSPPQPQQDEPITLLGYEKCLKENSI